MTAPFRNPLRRVAMLVAASALLAGCMKPADGVRSAKWENQAALVTAPAAAGY